MTEFQSSTDIRIASASAGDPGVVYQDVSSTKVMENSGADFLTACMMCNVDRISFRESARIALISNPQLPCVFLRLAYSRHPRTFIGEAGKR